MFVYREEYYLNKSEPVQKETETEENLICGISYGRSGWKNRMVRLNYYCKTASGPVGIANVSFEGRLTRFSDLANPDSLPETF